MRARPLAWTLLGAVSVALGPGCKREVPAPVREPAPVEQTWPDGTVLAVDGLPISEENVDRIAHAIGGLYPQYVLGQLRRLALTNVLLPQCAVAARDTLERAVEHERCATIRAAGLSPSPMAIDSQAGGIRLLGIDLWVAARSLEVGHWSDPIDLIGRWVLVRLDNLTQGDAGQGEWLELSLLSFPYIDVSDPDARTPFLSTESALDGAQLQIVEPGWGEFVPEAFQYRMRRSTMHRSE